MESDRPRGLSDAPPLAGALIAGALLGGLLTLAAGYAIDGIGVMAHDPRAGHAYRAWLTDGGWIWPSVYGMALGAWFAGRRMPAGRRRFIARAVAVLLGLSPLVWHPFVPAGGEPPLPSTAAGKIRAIRRWSYRSPETVARLLPLSRDADPAVRARAALALGVNLIVTDIEHDRPAFPARHLDDPLRDSLRVRLVTLLGDPVEEVRCEAARALWKAPRTFGRRPAAAETLAAVLERRAHHADAGREAWLALDAAAGARDTALVRAVRDFAAVSPDTALARIAGEVLAAPAAGR